MYNSTELLFDNELTTLSYKTAINSEFKIDEIQNSYLWKVETINENLIKAIPLFNCEEIVSNNSDDIILEDNKCVILKIDEDTIVKCKSNDRKDLHFYHTIITAFIPYTDPLGVIPRTVYGVLADEFMNPIVNAEIEVLVDNVVEEVLITDNNGMVEYVFTHGSNLSFRYNMDRQYYII